MVSPSKPITVLLADPNDAVRARLRSLLSRDERFRVVGEAASDAPAVAAQLQPDLIITDPAQGGQLDLELIDELRQAAPHSPLAVLTRHFDLPSLTAAVQRGIHGYFLHTFAAQHEALLDTLVPIARWWVASTGPTVARAVQSATRPSLQPPAPDRPAARLTAREREVLMLHLQGMNDKAIAERLRIDRSTVEYRIEEASRRVGATDRIQLGWLLHARGLL